MVFNIAIVGLFSCVTLISYKLFLLLVSVVYCVLPPPFTYVVYMYYMLLKGYFGLNNVLTDVFSMERYFFCSCARQLVSFFKEKICI